MATSTDSSGYPVKPDRFKPREGDLPDIANMAHAAMSMGLDVPYNLVDRLLTELGYPYSESPHARRHQESDLDA